MNIQSTIGIYEEYVQNGPLPEFYTFQYSQDHLETYFSLVRSSLGWNINPNVQQFQCAYRKLLFCTPHISGGFTNCNIEFPDALLEVSSVSQQSMPLNLEAVLRAEMIELDLDYDIIINTELEPYEQHVCALSASSVEANIIKNIKMRSVSACQDCLNIFDENHRISDSLIARKVNRGQSIKHPCTSTMNIIKVTEEITKILPFNEFKSYTSMAKSIFNVLEIESLFESSHFDLHHNKEIHNSSISHKEEFTLSILENYLQLKSKNICARISLEEQREASEKRQERRQRILDGR